MRLLDATALDRARYTELERRIRSRAKRQTAIWPLLIYALVLLGVIGAIGVSAWRIQ